VRRVTFGGDRMALISKLRKCLPEINKDLRLIRKRRSQALVFLTHIETERIYAHFLRLKNTTRGLLDVFLCVHEPTPHVDSAIRLRADFRISSRDEEQILPKRFAEKLERGGAITPGFPDLAYMPAILSPRLSSYGHIWLMEYDVDYSGDWKDFFTPLVARQADLLATTILPRNLCPGWTHWRWVGVPIEVSPNHHICSFNPIVRFSRPMLNCYLESMQSGKWRGHTEALYATLASYNSLLIEDIGGLGPFTPPSMRALNYFNKVSANDIAMSPGTFVYAPVSHFDYFYEAPDHFSEHGYLHHPVKVAAKLSTVAVKGALVD
jgi:hypothetical protein